MSFAAAITPLQRSLPPSPIDLGAAASLGGPLGDLGRSAANAAPFLARMLQKEGAWLAGIATEDPDAVLAALVGDMQRLGGPEGAPDLATLQQRLRESRRRAALFIALADLGGVWPLEQVTAALTTFAGTATSAAMDWLLAREARTGKIKGLDPETPGLFALAMGKMGAFELNYSSDIDLICLFDIDRYAPEGSWDAKERLPRLVRDLVKVLSEPTADGYVARVDLRLRPDPGATPLCLSTDAAEQYYAAMGRTWERAAHIKARVVAGDAAAGEAYLQTLSPFIWRRSLDFAAIEDTAR
ncbi:MAG: glutamine-synthetase adenylyltransferase, partial [Pseudomonadota bacterium]